MNSDSGLPLNGITILLTRAQEQNSEACNLFESYGARVLELPALVIGAPSDWNPLDNALLELKNFDWIIFSSANGIKSVENRLKLIGRSLSDKTNNLKIAVVGKKTAKALQVFNINPILFHLNLLLIV